MRVFDRDSAILVRAGVVDVARWEQFDVSLPFSAMWYTVPPGGSSPRDRHPEIELSVVLDGTAVVEVAGADAVEVAAGSSFLLAGDEAHVVHNPSSRPLVVFSAYWMPGDGATGTPVAPAEATGV